MEKSHTENGPLELTLQEIENCKNIEDILDVLEDKKVLGDDGKLYNGNELRKQIAIARYRKKDKRHIENVAMPTQELTKKVQNLLEAEYDDVNEFLGHP